MSVCFIKQMLSISIAEVPPFHLQFVYHLVLVKPCKVHFIDLKQVNHLSYLSHFRSSTRKSAKTQISKCTTWWNSQMATQKARKIRMSQHNPSLNLHLLHFLDFIFYFYVWTFIISFIFSLFSNKNDKLLFKHI